ncbi:Protein of unknown function [Andreprevotia lacus DSM 23236]|uniref:DUF2933 domain-containing protein n=1 Tax=Andreprevotia lacus DSM 23236 TaxID=1121001 RepID=A0A1W1XZK7_9NEIS|nr:DUF2933 domain-containing protein [Andreprevotia lacus]SMC29409.1 Protein of unknown function [Andreprevotia lacus DSM 23236]
MQHEQPTGRYRWVFWCFAAIAAFFLLTEHTAHVLGALPYLLLAACPLMHVFMHHGHGHHHGHDHTPARRQQDERKEDES